MGLHNRKSGSFVIIKSQKNTALCVLLLATTFSATAHENQLLSWHDDQFYFAGAAITKPNLDIKLRQMVQAATVLVPDMTMPQQDIHLILVQRQTRPLPMHRCGAGTEEELALLRYSNNKLRLLNRISIHSCEERRLLVNEDFTMSQDPLTAIQFHGNHITFLATPPLLMESTTQLVTHKYKILNGRFVPE